MNYREKTEKIMINKFKSIKKGLSTFVERTEIHQLVKKTHKISIDKRN